MKGAIFYNGKYGSTEQYARWIGEATNLPVLDCKEPQSDPADYDFLILGSSIILFRLTIRKWIRANWKGVVNKPVVLFSVSGAGASPKLERWVARSLPENLRSRMAHVPLRGRLDHSKLGWGMRVFMQIGSLFNRDPEASRDERYGFDYVDKQSIAPIVELINQFQEAEVFA